MPMPITYSIDKRNGIISEVRTGQVSTMDLAAHWKRLLADPDALAIRRTPVDLRNSDIAFSGEQMFDLVRTMVEPTLNGRDLAIRAAGRRLSSIRGVTPVSSLRPAV